MQAKKILPYTHNPAYDRFLIAIYGNWLLYLNPNQRYLGRSYAWWAGGHVDRMDVSQLPLADLADLYQGIAGAFSSAVASVWGATHVNYAWLGNEVRKHQGHGHLHLVPRYFDKPGSLDDRQFPDPAVGRNWIEAGARVLEEPVLMRVRDALRVVLAFENAAKARTLEEFLAERDTGMRKRRIT